MAMSSPSLPAGWYPTAPERARMFLDELRRELRRGHRLRGATVEVFADRDGASDDVLFRLVDHPDRFAIVHLTWRRRPEISPEWPRILFEGTFDEFVAYDAEHWGLEHEEDE
jgi:hypothetical protein